MEYKIKALSVYEYGQRKDKAGNPHQEDWLYPSLGNIDDSSDRLFILCDGMGGHAAGEVASSTVCEAMSRTIVSAMDAGEEFSESLLQKAIDAAYDSLDAKDNGGDTQKKMGTTMTLLMLHRGGYTVAHMGDSRVYLVRPRKGTKEDIVFRTEDHSLVNDLVKIGELTPEEAETYPHRNVITRAMQPHLERRHKADVFSSRNVRPGDYFFMCSDGMLEQMTDDNLCFNLNEDMTDEEKIDRLVKLTRNNRDNHSAHLIHILDVQLPSEIEDDPLPSASAAGYCSNDSDDGVDVVDAEFDNDDETVLPADAKTGNKSGGGDKNEHDGAGGAQTRPHAGDNMSWRKWLRIIIPCVVVLSLAAGGMYMSGFGGKDMNVQDNDTVKEKTKSRVDTGQVKLQADSGAVTGTPRTVPATGSAGVGASDNKREVSGVDSARKVNNVAGNGDNPDSATADRKKVAVKEALRTSQPASGVPVSAETLPIEKYKGK